MKKIDINAYLTHVSRDFDRKAMNPPAELTTFTPKTHDDWVFVGYLPKPKSRIGWFVYHMMHGLAMGYPLRSVIAFSLLNTNVSKKPASQKNHSQKHEQANLKSKAGGLMAESK
ncbi:MAG: hypothetical protein AAF639_17740 [Chloroflexota bacterium]